MGNYFIRIDDAPDLRRKVLESSKASLHMLKGYQQLVRIRGEKISLMNDLRRELKEITVLLNRIEELTPTLSDAELAEMQAEGIKAPKGKKKGRKQELPALPGEQAVFIGMPGKHPPKKRDAPTAPSPAALQEPVKEITLDDQISEIERRLKRL